jgi:hypothetical protein
MNANPARLPVTMTMAMSLLSEMEMSSRAWIAR